MPVFDATTQAHLEERKGTNAKVLLWFRTRNRETGAPETLGFWSGDDHQEFLINGEVRTYYGAGNVINVPPLVVAPGFQTRYYRVTIPPFTDEVKTLLQAYEPRLATVEIHSICFELNGGRPTGDPVRVFKGFLNQAPEELGAKGGTSRTELTLATAARRLTHGLPLKRSGDELKRRNPNDRGREYSDVAGDWTVPWGT
ncbi:hypothetical protein [Phaeobacter inhibens]|uniref:hypothetical protein n=1 Tax=Phaeobacter inhibens TaxID=221822 RepID=UPI00076BBC7D|nr:hypothetical protein [Phaeobacter inhibens]KXF92085.1 hypothetical protein AT574_03775 [Phaeobacter inhibens]WHP69919.1 hypothetical protein QMZ01_07025 [Phaeobacter inhibens]